MGKPKISFPKIFAYKYLQQETGARGKKIEERQKERLNKVFPFVHGAVVKVFLHIKGFKVIVGFRRFD